MKYQPKVELLDKTKKKKIIEILEEDFGISELPYLLIKTSREKIRAYSGGLSWKELNELAKIVHVELIGVQLCSISDESSRLNFDVLNLPEIKNQISKNIVELSDSETGEWLKGKNIDKKTDMKGSFLAVKNKGDFVGIAQNRKEFLQNYIPKERRIKN